MFLFSLIASSISSLDALYVDVACFVVGEADIWLLVGVLFGFLGFCVVVFVLVMLLRVLRVCWCGFSVKEVFKVIIWEEGF